MSWPILQSNLTIKYVAEASVEIPTTKGNKLIAKYI